MKKITTILSFVMMCIGLTMQAQDAYAQSDVQRMRKPLERPSVFELVDEVRDSIGLDTKEFDKVYQAYAKFNNKVFGSDTSAGGNGKMPQGGRPGGRSGMGGPGGGGMGGPGMGGPGGGRMGRGGMGRGGMGTPPTGGNGQTADQAPRHKKESVDLDKLEKTRVKEEEKLNQKMEKIFKDNPEKFIRWQAVRTQQLARLFPSHPAPQE